MSQPHVFVSYSHQDDAFTQRLVADLRAAGAEAWFDISGIDYGDFMGRIDEALRQCEWLVLVLSPAAIGSQYVKMEVNAGLHRVQQGKMRAVIPVLAAPCPPDSIPALWDMQHRYDATSDYSVALTGLCRALGLTAPTSAPPTAPAAQPTARVVTQSAPTLPVSMPDDRLPPSLVQLGVTRRSMFGG
jgi:hypothetical protein